MILSDYNSPHPGEYLNKPLLRRFVLDWVEKNPDKYADLYHPANNQDTDSIHLNCLIKKNPNKSNLLYSPDIDKYDESIDSTPVSASTV